MRTSSRFAIAGSAALLLVAVGCRTGVSLPPGFADGLEGADQLTLYEGLPHDNYETELFKSEWQSKPVREIGGRPFYKQPLA